MSNPDRGKRQISMTEKGRLYKLGLLQIQRAEHEESIHRQLSLLNCMLDSESVEIDSAISKLDDLFCSFLDIHSRCQALMVADDEMEYESVTRLDREVCEIKKRYHDRQAEDFQKKILNDQKSIKSSVKDSKHSSGSSRSSSSSKKAALKERAKLAELEVERKFLYKRIEAEKVKNEMETAKASARLKVYEEDDDQLLEEVSRVDKEEYVKNFVLNHRDIQGEAQTLQTCIPSLYKEDIKETKPSNLISSHPTERFMESFSDMLGYLQAPQIELDTFSGNPLDYDCFMVMFKESVEKRIRDPQSCLARLMKYLEGEAKELVTGCIHLPPAEGYKYAKELLQRRYGDKHRIACEYMKELKNWPKLKANDSASYRKLQSFIIKFEANMISRHSTYDTPELIQLLSKKLPIRGQFTWNRFVLKIRKTGREVKLKDFIGWIEEETTLVDDPLFSMEALSEDKSKSTFIEHPKRTKSFLVGESKEVICAMCHGNHDLDECAQYLRLKIDDRRKFLFRCRLCFACYKPTSTSHSARTCERKRSCAECHGQHPTGLHGFVRKEHHLGDNRSSPIDSKMKVHLTHPLAVSASALSTSVISLCVVPVKIYHSSNPKVVTNSYALLDNGSQGTFIMDRVVNELNVDGHKSSLSLRTIHGERKENCLAIDNLVVAPRDDNNKINQINLPRTYSITNIPVDAEDIPTSAKLSHWPYLDVLRDVLPKTEDGIKVELLIGGNVPKALEPIKVIPSKNGGPYAYLTRLGWCIAGPISGMSTEVKNHLVAVQNEETGQLANHFFKLSSREVKDNTLKEMLLSMYKIDFNENATVNESLADKYSQEESRFLEMMKTNIQLKDGHYELPLPFRDKDVQMPDNRKLALVRLNHLKKKLERNEKLSNDYISFMEELFKEGFAVTVKDTSNHPNGNVWYIPHHPVYHPRKPNKIRVVFDCSATFQGVSLNSKLMQGPDLANQLVGVLHRFRQDRVAVIGDLKKMFYQVNVKKEHQDFLRFLWWPNGKFFEEPIDCKMRVHLFGAVSSPSCANFALKTAALQFREKYGKEASSVLQRNFYVDDMLKSTPTVKESLNLLSNVQKMCSEAGFHLEKIGSTSREVIDNVLCKDRMKGIQSLQLTHDSLPIERVLGVSWCIENDHFNFRIVLQDKPLTRRGILSTVGSIYDPIGFAGPVMLSAKRVLQEICYEKRGWDDAISEEHRALWSRWRLELPSLEKVTISRCFFPPSFGEIKEVTLHHFCDASTIGYGQCSYLRFENIHKHFHCSFVMGKCRVAPLKAITIPRLELVAATTSARVSRLINKELEIVPAKEVFWTDSMIVLGYISNATKPFQTFVANRVQTILENSKVEQWNYVPSESNPADLASRGMKASELSSESPWIMGPSFLWRALKYDQQKAHTIDDKDPELKKKAKVFTIKDEDDFLVTLTSRISDWYKLKRLVATILKWRQKDKRIDVENLLEAEIRIVKLLQSETFYSEIQNLTRNKSVKNTSNIIKLNPTLDPHDGLLRVGGRLGRSCLSKQLRNPILLPKKNTISTMVARWCHQQINHGGRGATLNHLRECGYWIVNANTLVRSIISSCVHCRIMRGKIGEQRMAILPVERTESSPPFTYCAVDMFGHFIIREGRKEMKRYVALFTCLSSRAVHLEVTSALSTDSFILALRRFISRRGNVRMMRSDNGTNFVGTDNEFRKAMKELDDDKIKTYLLEKGADWIKWKRNTPAASHMGGVWERQIRSARSILSSLLRTHGHSLNDESFRTLLVEVESILNSRPLTTDVLSDPHSLLPLTPNHLLTMKSKIILPPPGIFQKADLYCRKQWRRVQHITDEFWRRWRVEYLQSLQVRQKWNQKKRNFIVNDVVLLKEGDMRNDWRLARITHVKTDEYGDVRSCTLTTRNTTLERPIQKLILLVEGQSEQL